MARLMDIGLERLKGMVLDMAKLSESTVTVAIDSYVKGEDLATKIHASSEELLILQDEVSELAVELIARYQPVASDLRFIKSCMEISYGFSRFGRYAYDISQVMGIFHDLSGCDKGPIERAGQQAEKMIRLSIKAFSEGNVELAKRIDEMDEVVDNIYRDYLRDASENPPSDLKCTVSATLILRYLERIADHATYIGESVLYIATGERASRR